MICESVEIHVVKTGDAPGVAVVGLEEDEGRRGHGVRVAPQTAEESTHKGCLAGREVSFEEHHVARSEVVCEGLAEGLGGLRGGALVLCGRVHESSSSRQARANSVGFYYAFLCLHITK